MLGDSGRSFVVGFGDNYPLQPHHKAAACASPPAECTWSTFGDTSTNNPHQLDGALVGGPKYSNDQFQDIRTDYIMNEVTLDYNAGFQSAVAGLKARACGSNTTGEPSQTQPTGATSETITSETTTSVSTSGSEQPTTEANGECNSFEMQAPVFPRLSVQRTNFGWLFGNFSLSSVTRLLCRTGNRARVFIEIFVYGDEREEIPEYPSVVCWSGVVWCSWRYLSPPQT